MLFIFQLQLAIIAKSEVRKTFFKHTFQWYYIQPNYHVYPYKCSVKQFYSLQITASVLFVYFFIKAYLEDTHSNCIDKQMTTHNIRFHKEDRKKNNNKKHRLNTIR